MTSGDERRPQEETGGDFQQRSQELLEVVDTDAGGVFILYEYELKDGARHRNTEYLTVRDGQVA